MPSRRPKDPLTRDEFDLHYWGSDYASVPASTRREFYSDYRESGYSFARYKRETTQRVENPARRSARRNPSRSPRFAPLRDERFDRVAKRRRVSPQFYASLDTQGVDPDDPLPYNLRIIAADQRPSGELLDFLQDTIVSGRRMGFRPDWYQDDAFSVEARFPTQADALHEIAQHNALGNYILLGEVGLDTVDAASFKNIGPRRNPARRPASRRAGLR